MEAKPKTPLTEQQKYGRWKDWYKTCIKYYETAINFAATMEMPDSSYQVKIKYYIKQLEKMKKFEDEANLPEPELKWKDFCKFDLEEKNKKIENKN